VLAVIGVPAAALFVAGGWILALFSPAYAAGGGALLKILVVAAIPDAITNLAVAHWRSHGNLRRCLRLNLLMAATCLVLTWLWLRPFGIEAAGLAWLTGQSLGALLVAAHALFSRLFRRAGQETTPARERPTPRPRQPRARRPLLHPLLRGRPALNFDNRSRRPAPHSRPRSRSWRAP
jgi:Na+-driven multidrug efflux pump